MKSSKIPPLSDRLKKPKYCSTCSDCITHNLLTTFSSERLPYDIDLLYCPDCKTVMVAKSRRYQNTKVNQSMCTKCGNCGKEYTREEYSKLRRIPSGPLEDDGFTYVCNCGYVFHKDRLRLIDHIFIKTKIGKIKIIVSTTFLEIQYAGGYWYETMILPQHSDLCCELLEGYATKEGAIEGHERILYSLQKGKYKVEPSEYLLTIDLKDK